MQTDFSSPPVPPLPRSYNSFGIDTIREAFEGFYLTGNKRHKVSLIATLQEMLLQRETYAFRRGGEGDFFSPPPSTCSDKPPLEAPKYLLLSVKSRLVPGKRSFQVIPEMKGRGNVCENA